MPAPAPAVIEFLLTRRSRPARSLALPVPDRAALRPILTAAVRVPDHGKLEPWRLIVLERAALLRLAALAQETGERLGMDADRIAKGVAQYAEAHLAVVVVAVPRSTGKIPEREQVLSAGAVCLGLLNAALASGWGANWLTGWAVEDPGFREAGLGMRADEWVAGVIFIGSETSPPPDRPRPDLDAVTTWLAG